MAEKKVLRAKGDDARISRVLNEDDDFMILEVAKRDDVTFHLQRNEDGEIVGGDQFYTILFIHHDGTKMAVWKPWEEK